MPSTHSPLITAVFMSIKQKEPPHRNPYAVRVFPYFIVPGNENPYFPLYTCFKIFSYGHHVTEGQANVASF